MAGNQIRFGADLQKGGAVMTASDGTKLAVFIDGLTLYLYSSIDGTPVLEDSDTGTTIHGNGNPDWCDAAIDGSDNIHIICGASNGASATRYISYNIATESGGSWSFGASWEEAAPGTQVGVPLGIGQCSIVLDDNDKPWVDYVDNVKQAGNTGEETYYVEKTGASWSSPVQLCVRTDKTWHFLYPGCYAYTSGYIRFIYSKEGVDTKRRDYTTSLQSESILSSSAELAGFGSAGFYSGTGHYGYANNGVSIYEGAVDTTYNTLSGIHRVGASWDGTTRFIFYIDTSADVHLITNTGVGAWTDEGVLQTGTFTYQVIVDYAFYNGNQVGEVSYMYCDATALYYDSFVTVTPGITPIPTNARRLRNRSSALIRR